MLSRRIFSHLYCSTPAWSQRICRSCLSDSERCSFLLSLMVVTTLLYKISSLLCGTLAVWMFEWVLHPHSHGIYYARVTAGIEKGKPQWSWDIFKSENWNLLITWNGIILDWYSGEITQLGLSPETIARHISFLFVKWRICSMFMHITHFFVLICFCFLL